MRPVTSVRRLLADTPIASWSLPRFARFVRTAQDAVSDGRYVVAPYSLTLLTSAIIIALSGCQATLPAVPTEVRVPIAIPCIDKLPDKPALFTDEQLSKMGDGELIISLRIDQLNARGYIAQADALMLACIK